MSVVSNAKIYDLEETLVASGYPMVANSPEERKPAQRDIDRCKKLVKETENGNLAHAQFLTGIRVAFDLTFSNKAWVEAERYRFLEFVSSQSSMHRITSMDLDNKYNKYVDPRMIEIMKEKVAAYNKFKEEGAKKVEDLEDTSEWMAADEDYRHDCKEKFLEIVYSNPSGFVLTARMTTNYRCLRNIYKQRKNHILPEWREFCDWIETLPYAEEFLIN